MSAYQKTLAYPIVEVSVLDQIDSCIQGRHYEEERPLAPADNIMLRDEESFVDDCFDFIVRQAHRVLEQVRRTTIEAAVDKLKTSAHWLYYKGFDAYLSLLEPLLGRLVHADIAHIKRKLRQAYVKGVLCHDDEDIMVRRLNAAVKRELAKFGKPSRLYVTYDRGCMYANELPEYVKMCLDGHHHVTLGDLNFDIYVMAKPRTGILDDLFTQMYQTLGLHNHVFICIYSDDQIYGGNIDGQWFLCNVDVASNDSSQDQPAFQFVGLAMACFSPQRAIGLLRQCRLPIRVSNPHDKSNYFDIVFNGPFEGSGSVLTTILNHSGSLLAAFAFCYLMYAMHELYSVSQDLIEQCIKRGFAFVGHSVTIDRCEVGGELLFERLQFLKHSPVKLVTPSGVFLRWGAMQNLACVFRSLGTTWDSLTASKLGVTQAVFDTMSDEQRLTAMCWQVTQGLCHQPNNCVKEALYNRFTPTKLNTSGSWWDWVMSGPTNLLARLWMPVGGNNGTSGSIGKVATSGEGSNASIIFADAPPHAFSDREVVDMHSICSRYDMEVCELDELVELIHRVVSGSIVACRALSKMYHVDYGVPL